MHTVVEALLGDDAFFLVVTNFGLGRTLFLRRGTARTWSHGLGVLVAPSRLEWCLAQRGLISE